ncbi:MAG: hypothetical protein GVY19_10250 [Bacteroidetes bacterium]|jgi:hypothetical protein|nr:hypothetical protein [Bacteroidota bacterium]
MNTTKHTTSTQNALDMLFDEIFKHLKNDQQSIRMGFADKETEDFYHGLLKNSSEVHSQIMQTSSMALIEKAIYAYGKILKEYEKNQPLKLGMHYATNKLLIFAIIRNDDEKSEDALLLTEAKVNNMFKDFGIHVSTTILEEEDNYTIPEQYKIYIDNAEV